MLGEVSDHSLFWMRPKIDLGNLNCFGIGMLFDLDLDLDFYNERIWTLSTLEWS